MPTGVAKHIGSLLLVVVRGVFFRRRQWFNGGKGQGDAGTYIYAA